MPRTVRSLVLACLLLPFSAAAAGGPAVFEESAAFRVHAFAPIVKGDLRAAHEQALRSGFRQAIAMARGEIEAEENVTGGTRHVAEPERYVRAYRISQQSRADIYYRLHLLIWVDRALVRDELVARTESGGLLPPGE